MIGQPRADLTDYGHLLVRRAVLRDDWISDEILELAANGQRDWTVAEWTALLTELQASKLRLRDWLILYT